MKKNSIFIVFVFFFVGGIWVEEFLKDILKVIDVEEIVVIVVLKENCKLCE